MPHRPAPAVPALVLLPAAAALLIGAAPALAQLRVVDYNAGAIKPDTAAVLQQIGRERVNGIAKPIDVLLVQEQGPGGPAAVAALLNGLYGAGTYAAAPLVGDSSGGGRPGMVYRPAAVALLDARGVGTVSSSANARQTARYQLRPVGYGPAADLYVYDAHYKASRGDSNAARRLAEAASDRADADALGPGRNVLFAGDLNLYGGAEAAYQKLLSPGNAQATDPTGSPLNWSNNPAARRFHTQSPATVSAYGGQVLGGVNDRFDLQLGSDGLNDGRGVALVPGSYRAFGNNGTHPLGGAINAASNTWNPDGLTAAARTVLNDLARASDHLPVVADYQVPAVLAAAVGPVPGRVIVGADVPVAVAVSNAAAVVAASGADALDYAVSGTGGVGGSASGRAFAIAPARGATLRLGTAAPGRAAGTVSVTTTSEAAAGGPASAAVSADVLAHARPVLAAAGGEAAAGGRLVLDFGIRARGSRPATLGFSVANAADAVGGAAYTAGLDLGTVGGVSDGLPSGSPFATDLTAFAGLAAGGSRAFAATLDTAALGTFASGLTLAFADEELPGAASLGGLSLSLAGTVATGGDANLDGRVDAADLSVLARDLGQSGPGLAWSDGDFDRNGRVDALDLRLLAIHYGNGPAAFAAALSAAGLPAAAVPEPAAGAVLLLAGAGGLLRRRRSSSRSA